MDISAIFKAVPTPNRDRNAESFAFLKPGDKLIGKVLHLEADGRVLIDLGGVRALAHTTVPVQEGQRLPLKVIQTGMPIQLRLEAEVLPKEQSLAPQTDMTTFLSQDDQQRAMRIVDRLLGSSVETPTPSQAVLDLSKNVEPELLKSAFGTEAGPSTQAQWSNGQLPDPVRQALIYLKSIFEPMALEAPVSQQTQWVQSAVEDRGILFEIKLADVLEKGAPADLPKPFLEIAAAQTDGTLPPKSPSDSVIGPNTETALENQQNPSPELRPGLKTDLEVGDAVQSKTIVDAGTAAGSRVSPDGLIGQDLKTEAASRMGPDRAVEKSRIAPPHTPDEQIVENVRNLVARDLKPQLLILKSFLGAMEQQNTPSSGFKTEDTAFLHQAVTRLLTHVEQQQEHAVRRGGEPDLYQVFTHMLAVKDQSMPVRLKVYYPKKGRAAQNDPQHRIALLLDMDHLGAVRADLAMVEQSLRINFFVSDESVRTAFERHSQSVADALEGVFEQVQIDTQVSKEKIAQFEGEDLMGPPLGRIDVKA